MNFFKFTHPEVEFIIVDNGSTDGTVRKIKDFLSKERKKEAKLNVRIIENETNIGIAKAVNTAFRQSSGELLVKLDNDIIVHDTWLEYLWCTYVHFKNKLGVCCLEVRNTEGKPEIPKVKTKGSISQILGQILFERTPVVNGAAMALSRSFWEKNRFSEDRLYGHEDAILAKKAWSQGYVCGQLRSPNTWVIHLQGDGSFRKYDLWKSSVAKIGRDLFYKKNVSCIPFEHNRILEIEEGSREELKFALKREKLKDQIREEELKERIVLDLKEEIEDELKELRTNLKIELVEELTKLLKKDLMSVLKKELGEDVKSVFSKWGEILDHFCSN